METGIRSHKDDKEMIENIRLFKRLTQVKIIIEYCISKIINTYLSYEFSLNFYNSIKTKNMKRLI